MIRLRLIVVLKKTSYFEVLNLEIELKSNMHLQVYNKRIKDINSTSIWN